MLAVIQRVSEASVSVENQIKASITQGLLVLLGIEESDDGNDIPWLANKIMNLRIFSDVSGVMNLSIRDVGGQLLVVSQFTLHASTRKGNRPSYIKAAKPDTAIPIYRRFINYCQDQGSIPVEQGEFGANMKVKLVNEGPVTIIIDSKNRI